MRIRLQTQVKVDDATFWFGAADDELLKAIELLTIAAPIIAMSVTGLGAEEVNELAAMSDDEIAALVAGKDYTPDNLPGSVKQGFCRLFVAAVKKWEGVTDEDGADVPFGPEVLEQFPTDEKVAAACEYMLERKRTQAKETAPGD